MVTLATAHPAKFADAVEAAAGRRPDASRPDFADLLTGEEHFATLANDRRAVEDISSRRSPRARRRRASSR